MLEDSLAQDIAAAEIHSDFYELGELLSSLASEQPIRSLFHVGDGLILHLKLIIA